MVKGPTAGLLRQGARERADRQPLSPVPLARRRRSRRRLAGGPDLRGYRQRVHEAAARLHLRGTCVRSPADHQREQAPTSRWPSTRRTRSGVTAWGARSPRGSASPTPSRSGGIVRGSRSIAGPTRRSPSISASATAAGGTGWRWGRRPGWVAGLVEAADLVVGEVHAGGAEVVVQLFLGAGAGTTAQTVDRSTSQASAT